MAYIGEFVGTALLMMFGNGLLAGLHLNKTLAAKDANWVVVTTFREFMPSEK